MKEVAVFPTRAEAEMWCVPLKENNVPYILQGNDYGGINPLIGMVNGIQVLVADDMTGIVGTLKETGE